MPAAPPSARRRRPWWAMCQDVDGITLGADKAFDVAGHVAKLREMNVTPHVAQNTTNRASAIDGRTTRHPGYALSQRIRQRIEEASAGSKSRAACARPATEGSSVSNGVSPSPRPPT